MYKLITIEGVDAAGKTTIAKKLAEIYNFEYQHEPRFSSDFADKLNFTKLDSWQREFYFMKDRIDHQEFLNNHNVVLDRYILSGLAYAQCFSSKVLPMMKSIYSLKNSFKFPDINIYIKVRPEFIVELNESRKKTKLYNPKLKLNIIKKLQKCFFKQIKTIENWGIKVLVVDQIENNINCLTNNILELLGSGGTL